MGMRATISITAAAATALAYLALHSSCESHPARFTTVAATGSGSNGSAAARTLPDDPTARALVGVCAPLGCTSARITPPDAPPIPLIPDTRPVRAINMFGGRWECNDAGLVPWANDTTAWPGTTCADPANTGDDGCVGRPPCTDGVPTREFHQEWAGNGQPDTWDKLESLLDRLYAAGWRRILINRPAGMRQGDSLSSAQYWTLSDDMRKVVDGGYLAEWRKAHRDAELGVYMGWRVFDPCRLVGKQGPHRIPDPASASDMCLAYQNIHPWATGSDPTAVATATPDAAPPRLVDEVWLDNSATVDGGLAVLLRYVRSASWAGVKLVGEPIPQCVGTSCASPWDTTAFAQMPFIASQVFMERHGYTSTTVPDVTSYNPRELYVAFTGARTVGEPITEAVVRGYRDRGYIPISWNDRTDAAVIAACGGPATPCQ